MRAPGGPTQVLRAGADRKLVGHQLALGSGRLFFGDNLDVLRKHVEDESVDLIYLDPPFNSNRSYNVLFQRRDGSKPAGQVKAFDDTWRWGMESARLYEKVVGEGGETSAMLRGLRAILGTSDMLAYVTMMTPRLVEMRRTLKATGSLYLHCDPTASHYLKVMLDAIFGPTNFRGEITWQRTNAHNDAKRWSPVADVIFYYGKTDRVVWNTQYSEYDAEYVASKYRFAEPDGRRYRLSDMRSPQPRPNLTYEWKGHRPHRNGWAYSVETMERLDAEGRIWYPDSKSKRPQLKRYLDERKGAPMGNVWTDIRPINSRAAERLGYPTQKPLALLERIIAASSDPGDLVLDPFCGCGTAVDAAQKLGRRWIGIDVTEVAIEVIRDRLQHQFGTIDYVLGGEPGTVDEAEALARIDKYEFQRWACEQIGIKAPVRKGADRGIDGEFNGTFDDGSSWRALVSVKGGGVTVNQVRDLVGTMTREEAEIGVFVTLKSATAPMKREAAEAGFTETGQARLQILTVEEILRGQQPDLPARSARAPAVDRRLRAV